jgi:hypothetical protein
MNKVKIECSPSVNKFKEGDIFEKQGENYMLAYVNDNYALISFRNGWTWSGLHTTIGEAIDGATFIGRNVTITISK